MGHLENEFLIIFGLIGTCKNNTVLHSQGQQLHSVLYILQIERWWRELHERLEKYFKPQLKRLAEEGNYDPSDISDRSVKCTNKGEYIGETLHQHTLNSLGVVHNC